MLFHGPKKKHAKFITEWNIFRVFIFTKQHAELRTKNNNDKEIDNVRVLLMGFYKKFEAHTEILLNNDSSVA